jgi:hypothetical protein
VTKGDLCNDPTEPHYGLQLERIRLGAEAAYWCPKRDIEKLKTPWIFGVSDSRGYINFFGEEFCYESSPYVTQGMSHRPWAAERMYSKKMLTWVFFPNSGNVFSRFYQDIESHFVFCRLVERKLKNENSTIIPSRRWGVDLTGPCLDGTRCSQSTEKSSISLEFMEKMWDTYVEKPKFAFLNAMAAHDYSHNWENMTLLAERYDEKFYQFLEKMISRKDSNRTVIIIRSDHGIQRGPQVSDMVCFCKLAPTVAGSHPY